ncbi:hypothetical protein [Pontivivens insulae]|uniref:Cytochrome C oxidase assembly protein n=1 Tax=Pontivivens insulae TaxID=1639689 RepID=A0A2R8A711_9RHOB|nr:hypothetical protein [Pontivivens insulae]RED18132.1 hypothetical protein DFR53_0325 [Pontivivens insulae]SPF28029.1 hypothetical protein POI8812_00326 [Pontivivens insulae]
MTLGQEPHEIYTRRKGRNVAVLIILLSFVALIFAVTMVKMQNGASMEAFDHAPRATLLPLEEEN